MMKPYETIVFVFERMVASLFDICFIPRVEISLGVTPVGLLWFSLSVACMKGLLEGSRISFQTLMQHHFITDHHCRGYVI